MYNHTTTYIICEEKIDLWLNQRRNRNYFVIMLVAPTIKFSIKAISRIMVTIKLNMEREEDIYVHPVKNHLIQPEIHHIINYSILGMTLTK